MKEDYKTHMVNYTHNGTPRCMQFTCSSDENPVDVVDSLRDTMFYGGLVTQSNERKSNADLIVVAVILFTLSILLLTGN